MGLLTLRALVSWWVASAVVGSSRIALHSSYSRVVLYLINALQGSIGIYLVIGASGAAVFVLLSYIGAEKNLRLLSKMGLLIIVIFNVSMFVLVIISDGYA